jgi:alpha-dioxygenase
MEDLFTMFTKFLVVPSLRGEYAKLTLLYKILFLIMHLFDKYLPWYKMPVVIGLFYLEIRRTVLYKHNLIPVGQTKSKLTFNPKEYPFRTANGMFNDPKNAETGSEDSFFGRNNEHQPQREKVSQVN